MYKIICFALLVWCCIAVTSIFGVQALLQFMMLLVVYFALLHARKLKRTKI